MGGKVSKQFLSLGTMPILAHTLSVFEHASFIEGIYVVSPEKDIAYCQTEIVKRHNFSKIIAVVAGGTERQHSVYNGLLAMGSGVDRDDLVLIHDGVRPFVHAELLRQAAIAADEFGGAVVAVPVKDTVKSVRNGFIIGTPLRELLWLAQTPQAFRFGLIMDAYAQAIADGFTGTDDASLIERQGKKPSIVLGDYRNIKITTPEDLILADAFFQAIKPEPPASQGLENL